MSTSVEERIRSYVREYVDWNNFSRQELQLLIRQESPLLTDAQQKSIEVRLWSEFMGLGVLETFLDDPEINEVLVNGPNNLWIERRGVLERIDVALDESTIRALIERIVLPLGERIDSASPTADVRLADGSRVHAMLPPLAVDGPYLAIRRFGARITPLSSFCSEEVARFLMEMVHEKYNIVVSGGTSSGKTTFLNALAPHISPRDRVVTVEDAAELRFEHPHVVRLEARAANVEGVGAVTIRDLVRNALRLRPDRIIVGEFRGGEAFDMLQAMNTGHDGSFTTCHANSVADALRRIEAMVLTAGVEFPLWAVREQIVSSIDMVVQLGRSTNGRRRIIEIAEVVGTEENGWNVRRLANVDRVKRPPLRPGRKSAVQ